MILQHTGSDRGKARLPRDNSVLERDDALNPAPLHNPKPLPLLGTICGTWESKEYTILMQREKEWREAVNWLKEMITKSRKKEGLEWHPYATETGEVKELIDEAFPTERWNE